LAHKRAEIGAQTNTQTNPTPSQPTNMDPTTNTPNKEDILKLEAEIEQEFNDEVNAVLNEAQKGDQDFCKRIGISLEDKKLISKQRRQAIELFQITRKNKEIYNELSTFLKLMLEYVETHVEKRLAVREKTSLTLDSETMALSKQYLLLGYGNEDEVKRKIDDLKRGIKHLKMGEKKYKLMYWKEQYYQKQMIEAKKEIQDWLTKMSGLRPTDLEKIEYKTIIQKIKELIEYAKP
jgi:hypothetical protein